MGRVFALSDIHGQRARWEQIKDYLNPDDTLFFLGDAIDRGPDGFAIMKELLTDKRVTYLKGNHELLMEDALHEIRKYENLGEAFTLWLQNGCYPTYKAWLDSGMNFSWIHILHNLPVEYTYINAKAEEVRMSHAGFTPGSPKADEWDLIWNRKHFFDEIPTEYKDCHEIVVHGHTPTVYLLEDFDEVNKLAAWNEQNGKHANYYHFQERDGIVVYGGGCKVNIDCGCFATGHTVLLNLGTWETVPFDAEIEDYELEIKEGDCDNNG